MAFFIPKCYLHNMTFFEKVYLVTQQIPLGRVSTYGHIANYLDGGSARAVGWALNKCTSNDSPVPAHRVVNRKGELSGRNFFPHPKMMQELLEQENISIEENQVVDFDNVVWDPSLELKKQLFPI